MITAFHATGANAGTLKCSNELEHPHHHAGQSEQEDDREQRREVDREVAQRRVVVEARREQDMIGSAKTMKSTVRMPRTVDQEEQVEATRNASRRWPFQQLGEDRDEGALEGGVGYERAHEVRTWKAIVNADIAPLTPK